MRTARAIGALVACAALLAWPAAPALACSFAYLEHQIDPAEQAVDTSPPSLTAASVADIRRGRGRDGCGATSCDDIGSLVLGVAAADDRTTARDIGYEIRVLSGNAPDFGLPLQPLRAEASGELQLVWGDGATDDQESLSFQLEITPVDLAGNRGQPVVLDVTDGGSGCSIGGRGDGLLVVLVLLASLLGRRRRRMP